MAIDRRRIANVCILDGRLPTPASTVHRLEELIHRQITRLHVWLERVSQYDEGSPLEAVFADFENLHLPKGSLGIGIGLVGLWVACYQELERPDLHVIAICSPGAIGAVKLTAKSERRVALYCSEDKSLMNKVADWPRSSEAHDVPFLRFGCDRHPYSLADLIVAYLHDCDLAWEIKYIFDEPPITVPSDSRYQAFVSDCVARKR